MMIKRISAPYSFVPLNREVYIPAWQNKVSQDIPFEDGEDGIIEVKWRNVSPLIIRDGSTDKSQVSQSTFINMPDGTRRYFIPGSSLKGMLRNVMAIMSFGKFKEYNKTHFNKRLKKEKVPYRYSVADLIEREQSFYDNKGLDLCETIFGYSGETGMKGRVQMGHAFCDNKQEIVMYERGGVLGQPKASYFPLYLKQNEKKGKYINYDDDTAHISGWKRYRIHRKNLTIELPQAPNNKLQISKFCPLKEGLTFTMYIKIHNLRKVEIGALLSAITFHKTKGIWHNIGGAKSFGYGKLEYCAVNLKGLQYNEEEYLLEFEKEMNKFTLSKTGEKWIECRRIKTLVAIASEHDDNEVRMMDLKEYNDSKVIKVSRNNRNNEISLPYQEEASKGFHSAINDEMRLKQKEEKAENKRQEYAKLYNEIKTLRNKGEFMLAKTTLEIIIKELKSQGISTEQEDTEIQKIKQEIIQKAQAEKLAIISNQIKKGLDNFLNEKYSCGTKCGEYKVDSWKICSDKLKKWMKESNESKLTTEEQDILEKVIYRLKNNHNKKEKKDWLKADSKIWNEVTKYLSKERAYNIFNNNKNYE